MTRRDYELIACAISEETEPSTGTLDVDGLVQRLADDFKADNPRFNVEQFIEACTG